MNPSTTPASPLIPPHFVQWCTDHKAMAGLVTLIVIDIVMGLVAAYGAKVLNSTVSWKGMSRKVAELLLVVTALVFDPYAQGIPIGTLTPIFFITTEFMSIIEKAAMIGVPIPSALLSALAKVKPPKTPVIPPMPAIQEGKKP